MLCKSPRRCSGGPLPEALRPVGLAGSPNWSAEVRDFAPSPAGTCDNILDSTRPKPFAFKSSGQDTPNPSNTIDGCEAFPEQEV